MNLRLLSHFSIVLLFLFGSIFSCPVFANMVLPDTHVELHATENAHDDCCPDDAHHNDEMDLKIVVSSFQKDGIESDIFFSPKKLTWNNERYISLEYDFFVETKHIDKQHLFFIKTVRLIL
jgi:hypothetical protein